jgi:hypothetical protein
LCRSANGQARGVAWLEDHFRETIAHLLKDPQPLLWVSSGIDSSKKPPPESVEGGNGYVPCVVFNILQTKPLTSSLGQDKSASMPGITKSSHACFVELGRPILRKARADGAHESRPPKKLRHHLFKALGFDLRDLLGQGSLSSAYSVPGPGSLLRLEMRK